MIKKIQILIALLLTTVTASSQKLSFEDLIDKTKCTSETCFENFLKNKHFSYLKNYDEDTYTMACYSGEFPGICTSNPKVTTPNFAFFIIPNDKSYVATSITTNDENYYKELISAIEKSGFKKQSSDPIKDGQERGFYTSTTNKKVSVKTKKTNVYTESGTYINYEIEVRRVN